MVSGVGNNRGVVGGGGVGGLGVCLSLVSHISDKSVLVICVVRHNLDTAVRELHSVFSLDNSILVLSFSLGKVSAVLISTSVLVCEWLRGHLLCILLGQLHTRPEFQSWQSVCRTHQHLRTRMRMA